jgi:hypothetical protein
VGVNLAQLISLTNQQLKGRLNMRDPKLIYTIYNVVILNVTTGDTIYDSAEADKIDGCQEPADYINGYLKHNPNAEGYYESGAEVWMRYDISVTIDLATKEVIDVSIGEERIKDDEEGLFDL